MVEKSFAQEYAPRETVDGKLRARADEVRQWADAESAKRTVTIGCLRRYVGQTCEDLSYDERCLVVGLVTHPDQ
jgi:hypothetical protein